MADTNPFAPCQLLQNEDGIYCLMFTDFETTASIFEEFEQDGGGYGWHGVVEALVRLRAPRLKKKLRYDPEASMFVVLSKDQAALQQVAELIRSALADPEVLREALRHADPELMD